MENEVCSCRARGPRYPDTREFRKLGFADSERFGTIDVRIEECLACGSLWLKCHHESDERPGAGAWVMAMITPEDAGDIVAKDAVSHIRKSDFCIEGGRSFGGTEEVMAGSKTSF